MLIKGVSNNVLIGGAVIVGAALWFITRKPAAVGQFVGAYPVELATGVLTGGVKAIGGAVGIPDTNQTQCQKDIAAGKTWDSSFSCPASTWIKSLFK